MRKIIGNILFSLVMIVMALVLAVAGTLICAVNILRPQHLTPIVEHLANGILDARVELGRVELSFEPSFPVLRLEVDSLSVLSKAFDSIPAQERAELPVWADTLLVLDRFGGSVDVGALLRRGEIAVRNVELVRPGVNIVLDRRGIGNFDIYSAASDTAAQSTARSPIPPFSVDRFAFVDPREIRYFNAVDGTSATVLLLREVELDGSDEPLYRINIDGHLASPLTKAAINLEDIAFGLDGRVHWHPEKPTMVTFEQINVRGAFLSATVDAAIDLDSTLIVPSAKVEVAPIAIADALSVLPDSLRRANRLIAPYFATDGAVGMSATLLKPFCPATDSVPAARATITMADCSLRYGKADFRRLGFDIEATTDGSSWNGTKVDIRRFGVAGPATAISLKASLADLLSDPAFDADLSADVELSKLPPVVADLAEGFIKGRVDAKLNASGRASMFGRETFHRLAIDGKLSARNLYYLSNDTAKMAEVRRLDFDFDSQRRVSVDSSGQRTQPLLSAHIKVDTATMLINGVNIALGRLALGAGVENSARSADTTIVVPVGGGISVGALNIESITDTAGARIRNMAGRVMLHRFKGESRVPEILLNVDLGRVSAGAPSTRFVMSKAHLDASLHKLPEVIKRRAEVRAAADSIRRVHPDISPDSVMRLVYERRKRRPHIKRVGTGINHADEEVIEWDLSKGFRSFLLTWQLNGTLSTRNARLFTPLFPLRNRINRLDIKFSNDSVQVRNLRYRAGRSDIVMKGLVSNIRRGLTSKAAGNSLKINFELNSDTIDVNQLSAAAFAGAAYARRVAEGGTRMRFDDNSDEALDKRLDALASQQPDTVGPLLIPTNLDGKLQIKANNIFYSDIAMTDLAGDILLYDGGVNLNRLGARSDAGNLRLSALYSAPKASDMHFGFGLDLERFNIERFLTLVPAVDSVLPVMRDFSGIINAELAATVDIDSAMNMVLPSLDAAVRITGDSLAFINPKTYATLGKWLRFRDRADNKIKHINVEMIVRDNMLQIFPFSFDIDRYRLGVVGYNDLNLNFDYHIAVLKSPIPFKFGITIKGNPDKFKVRFGGAKFKEGMVAESVNVVDTARVNLLQQIEGVFRRGVRRSRFSRLNVKAPDVRHELEEPDRGLSHADSLTLIREGLIEAPVIDENVQPK
ncbi:MAG: hypothetical protein NC418_06415 [Muribaculaceae bacterium]|nr:hypothetical protein [Muribaculaceae bacterium]